MDAGKTLVAMFAATSQTLTVSANPATGGTVFVNGTASTGVTNHNAGAQVNAIARPAEGYEFIGWVGASMSAGEEITVTMHGNQMLTANFRRQRSDNDTTATPPPAQYTLTVNRSPANGGTTSPESGLRHDTGTPIAITAAAASGYSFVSWTVTGGGTVANLTGTNTTVALSSNATVTANFRAEVVTPGAYTLTVNRSPAEGGTVFVDDVAVSGTTSHNPETQISIRAEAAVGYRFTGWTGTITSTAVSLPPLTMRANVDLTANFEYMGTRTLTINRMPVTGGRVFVNDVESEGITTQTVGMSVSIRVEPAVGYRFIGWTGGTASTALSISVTINNDSTLTANFEDLTIWQGSFTDSRDDQIYRTVTIGTQTWMVENLNFAGHLFGESWCYNNQPDSCAVYGRLYNWTAAMEGATSSSANPSRIQGVCPPGWHLPSGAEWGVLVTFAGGVSIAGSRLKSETGWTASPSISSTNDLGFSALPGGTATASGGAFSGAGNTGRWWTATETGAGGAFSYLMYNHSNSAESNNNTSNKGNGHSVRCVKDN